MAPLAAGLAVLLIALLFAHAFLSTDVKRLARGMRGMAGIVLALLAIGLVLMGRVGFAFLAGSVAWAILTGGRVGTNPFGRQGGGSAGPPASGAMSRAEALKVLGLGESAKEADIRAAHRRLIAQIHPDRGGSDYLAAKINQAKDVLLGR